MDLVRLLLLALAIAVLAGPARADARPGASGWRSGGGGCGNVAIERYRYSAYGTPTIYDKSGNQVSTTQVQQPFMFTGRRWDFEEASGLYYYRLRYYDPAAGRFVSRDPLGNWGDPAQLGNGQNYCGNNPVNFVDPYGLIVDVLWDLWNVGSGLVSMGGNLLSGNFGAAAVDAGGVVLDGLATAVPGVPGGASTGIKAARAADKAIDAAKNAERLDDAVDGVRAADRADDAVDAGRAADRASDASKGTPGGAEPPGKPPGPGEPGGPAGPPGPQRPNPDDGGRPASSPGGSRRSPMNTDGNAPTTIHGRDYTGHAIDRMQGRGIPPLAVEEAIRRGRPRPGDTPGTTVFEDVVNGVEVVVDTCTGRVVTVKWIGRN